MNETPSGTGGMTRCSICGIAWFGYHTCGGSSTFPPMQIHACDHSSCQATIAQQAETIAELRVKVSDGDFVRADVVRRMKDQIAELRDEVEGYRVHAVDLRAQLSERDSKLSAIAEASTYRDATPDQLIGIVGRITAEHSDLTDALEERDQQLAEMREDYEGILDESTVRGEMILAALIALDVDDAIDVATYPVKDVRAILVDEIAGVVRALSASRAREEKLRTALIGAADEIAKTAWGPAATERDWTPTRAKYAAILERRVAAALSDSEGGK